MMGKKSIIILIIFDTSEKTSENKNSSSSTSSSNHYCQSLTVHGLLWNKHFVPRKMNQNSWEHSFG